MRSIATLFMAILLAGECSTPCQAGDIRDYLSPDSKLKETLRLEITDTWGGKEQFRTIWVIEPSGAWTKETRQETFYTAKRTLVAKGQLTEQQRVALAHHLAAQDFKELPAHVSAPLPEEGWLDRSERINFGKKSTIRDTYVLLDLPGVAPKAEKMTSEWARFAALTLLLEDMLKRATKVDPKASPTATAQSAAVSTPDQQVAELVEAYRALPATAKLEAEGERIIERLHMVRGKLSPRSQEAVARLEASHSLRPLVQALQKNDQESLKILVSKKSEREVLAERLTGVLPYIEPPARKWEYKVLAESYVAKLGKGELAIGLSQLGEEGWELVGFEKGRFVFKREK
jgi:hypothetical protein